MATRGTIAVEHADGTVSQVYSHWDNYLEGTGQTLLDCYNTLQLAEALVSGGDISSVGSTVDSTEYYGRDRGEEGTDAYEFASLDSYYRGLSGKEHAYLCGEEYNYLFANGQWTVEHSDTGGEYVSLAEAVQTA
jgi:hypothetical protein